MAIESPVQQKAWPDEDRAATRPERAEAIKRDGVRSRPPAQQERAGSPDVANLETPWPEAQPATPEPEMTLADCDGPACVWLH